MRRSSFDLLPTTYYRLLATGYLIPVLACTGMRPSRLRRVLQPLFPVERFTRSDRRIVFVLWIAGVVQGFAQSQASATLPFTRIGLGLSEAEMSLLLGLARLAAFAGLALGWLGDRLGRRRPFLWAVTIVVAGGVASGLVLEAWQFGIAQAVVRTGAAAMTGLSVVILAEQASPAIRAHAIAFYGAAVSFGAGLALFTLPLADLSAEAWRIPHLSVAAGALVLPFLVRNVGESRLHEIAKHTSHFKELAVGRWAVTMWTVGAVGLFLSAYSALALAFSTERLIQHVGLSTGSAVTIALAGGTIAGIGFFVGGRLADLWGRKVTTVISLLLALVGGILFYWTELIPLIVVGIVLSSFGTFAFVPAGGSHRAELFPTDLRASANTYSANFSLTGSALGLLLGRVTIERLGLSETITVLGIGVVVAALLTLTLPETRGQDLTAVEATF